MEIVSVNHPWKFSIYDMPHLEMVLKHDHIYCVSWFSGTTKRPSADSHQIYSVVPAYVTA